jgi:hypothetical protein
MKGRDAVEKGKTTSTEDLKRGNRIMVIWADPAKSDLRSIHDFIASDSKYFYQTKIDGLWY